MSVDVTILIPTWNGADRLRRLLASLEPIERGTQILVVDNGSTDGTAQMLATEFPAVELLPLERNEGFSLPVNIGARRASGRALVLLNDDCVCEPGFVRAIVGELDPAAGIVMVASVMREAGDPETIDSAGMQLDATLLVFDYLNGEPISVLDEPVADPIGPSAAAAAFDRDAFLGAGGFDDRLFAYWEDVDLVLRLRRLGGRCALARDARGTHLHSATLGSGSREKNYLMGFGRGYLLRKWGVLAPWRLPAVLARELAICAGQAVLDRDVSGVRGRVAGFRRAALVAREPYPAAVLAGLNGHGLAETLLARHRRRDRLRSRTAA